jgi:hypothetical protein
MLQLRSSKVRVEFDLSASANAVAPLLPILLSVLRVRMQGSNKSVTAEID